MIRRGRGLTQAQIIFVLLVLVGGVLVAAPRIAAWIRRDRGSKDLAAEAKAYLEKQDVKPFTGKLDDLLVEGESASIPTLDHPLLGGSATDFELTDSTGKTHKLAEYLAQGPAVVVFYYGYYCNHCVAQLFALQDDLEKFHELGAEVLAISPDSPQDTATKFAKYGKFTYPVLADPGNQTASVYSMVLPSHGKGPQRLLHGTFVVDQQGKIRWCHYGLAPFTSNTTLLVELAKLKEEIKPPDTTP